MCAKRGGLRRGCLGGPSNSNQRPAQSMSTERLIQTASSMTTTTVDMNILETSTFHGESGSSGLQEQHQPVQSLIPDLANCVVLVAFFSTAFLATQDSHLNG